MITSVSYHDFPPFRKDSNLTLQQINLFVGVNGTGKTRAVENIPAWINHGIEGTVNDTHNITINFFETGTTSLKLDIPRLSIQAKNGDDTTGIFKETHYLAPSQRKLPSNFDPLNRIRTRDIESAPYGIFVREDYDYSEFGNKINELFDKTIAVEDYPRTGLMPSIMRHGTPIDPKDESTGFVSVYFMLQKLFVMPKNCFVILDEPTAFLNTALVKKFFDTVLNIVEKNGHQIIIISHDLSAIMYFVRQFALNKENLLINKFETNSDNEAVIQEIEHDNFDGFLGDVFGIFPARIDIDMLKQVSDVDGS